MGSGAAARAVVSGAAVSWVAASAACVSGVVVLVPAVVGMTSSRGWGIAGLVVLAVVVGGAAAGAAIAPSAKPAAGAEPRGGRPVAAGPEEAVGPRLSRVAPRLFALAAVTGLGLLVWGVVLIGWRLRDSWTGPVDALPVVAGLSLLFGGAWPIARWSARNPDPVPEPGPVQRAVLGLPPVEPDPDDAATPTAPQPGTPHRRWLGPGSDTVLGAVLGLALVAAVTVGGLVFVPGLAVDAATADPGPAPGPVTRLGPVSPAQAWSREIDGLEDVLAGVRGPLLVVGDGVVALEGRTGAQLWHFRVPRQRVQVGAGADGRTVVAFVPGRNLPRSRSLRMIVLDGATGRVRLDREVRPGRGEWWLKTADVDTVMVTPTAVVTETMGYQVARSLTDGRLLWQNDRFADACSRHEARVVGAVLVEAYTCPESETRAQAWVTGTDPGTGRSLWQHSVKAEHFQPPVMTVATSGDAVAISLVATVTTSTTGGGRGWAVAPADSGVWMLDPVTGAYLHQADPRTVQALRVLGHGWWLSVPWPSGQAGTTGTGRYTLVSPRSTGRTLPPETGSCLQGRVVTVGDGWVCQPMSAGHPTGYQVVPADPAVAASARITGEVWLTAAPGALVTWTDQSPARVSGLRW